MAKKAETVEIEGLEEDGAGEARVYELGFHLDPELPQEEVKKTYQSIHDAISKVGTIIAEGEPTKIPLAYTMYRSNTAGRRDFDTAFFCWIAYECRKCSQRPLKWRLHRTLLTQRQMLNPQQK